jgi:hypothetical protein
MMSLEQVRAALQDRRLPAVAHGAGLTYGTVWRVARGQEKKVSYETIKRLSDYLTGTIKE